ncbi:Leucine-rich repeat [Forsythia ovata]|uniref:Leucine-rich repeat n=1 Tax=Forsythia ovata TaxID=205694 RepID=A0ABD1WGR7_9LAMI
MKRVIGNSEVGNENSGFKKVRFFDGIDENYRGFETISGGEEKGIIENGVMGVRAIGQNDLLNENEASRSSEMDSSLLRVNDESNWDFDINFDLIFNTRKEENRLDFDINVPCVSNFDMKNGGTEMVFQEYTQCEPAINERRVEIIDIMSDESDDEVEIIAYKKDDIQKGKQIEVENLNLGLAMIGMENIVGESSLASGGAKRYTGEEKGKAPVVDSWLSVGPNYPVDLSVGPNYPIDLDSWPDIEGLLDICETWEDVHLLGTSSIEFREEQPPALADRAAILIRQEVGTVRYRGVSRQSAKQLARVDYLTDEFGNGSSSQEHKLPPLEADVQLGNSPGPFSDALKMIRARNEGPGAQKLIEWKLSEENHGRSVTMPLVPSLLDLSLRALAENAEGIVSLELVPDMLRRRLTDLLCDIRKMDVHILDLLVKGCPTEIRIKNCSWLTEKQFTQTFKNCESKCLRVLQLDLCGQCTLDYSFADTFAQSSNSLHNLAILSLRGACRLTDNGLQTIVMSAPALRSINLGQCTLLTCAGIKFIADSLGSILRELYIDDCQKIDAMLILPALKNFKHLEVLSVAGIPTVSDQFVNDMITICGRNIKDLDLASCHNLTDRSLQIIGSICTDLRSLNISHLHNLTDLGIEYLANGCRTIQKLKLCRNRFSDEAMAAFLESSGEFLEELLLNNVTKIGPNTALALAKCSRKLLSLDLSWCRQITDEALGLIVDSCLSLKLVKVFGCTKITDLFLNGHSNPLVRIVGLKLTPILQNVNMLEPEEVLLRYSPLPIPSESLR